MDFDVQSLFSEVADLAADAREKYFDLRGVPEDVRAEVISLCGFDGHDAFLTDSVAGVASDVLRSVATPAAGDTCGAYELVRLLGKGGFRRSRGSSLAANSSSGTPSIYSMTR